MAQCVSHAGDARRSQSSAHAVTTRAGSAHGSWVTPSFRSLWLHRYAPTVLFCMPTPTVSPEARRLLPCMPSPLTRRMPVHVRYHCRLYIVKGNRRLWATRETTDAVCTGRCSQHRGLFAWPGMPVLVQVGATKYGPDSAAGPNKTTGLQRAYFEDFISGARG